MVQQSKIILVVSCFNTNCIPFNFLILQPCNCAIYSRPFIFVKRKILEVFEIISVTNGTSNDNLCITHDFRSLRKLVGSLIVEQKQNRYNKLSTHENGTI